MRHQQSLFESSVDAALESVGAVTKQSGQRSIVQRCFDAYYDSFVRRFNEPALSEPWLAEKREKVPPAQRSVSMARMRLPLIHGGKDGKHLQKLIQTYGEERAQRLCESFVWMRHPRVVSSDYSIGAMFNLAQFLLTDADRIDWRRASNEYEILRASGRVDTF
jgi:hypothetical protein